MLLALVLWSARRHLSQVVRAALGRAAKGDDAAEPLSYRWASVCFLTSLAGLVYYCWLAGCRPAVGLLFIGTMVAYFVLMVRLRVEAGLGVGSDCAPEHGMKEKGTPYTSAYSAASRPFPSAE